jgi:predicted transcriptional regulator
MTESELLSAYNKVLAENVELKKELDWYKNYADRLVEHKDMVCLPADLKNLRESNLKLATENEELKKKVETLKGVITQAWFTDVEEKDKQIEYLLQKVKELSDPELKDDTDYIY